ncbi:MAG: rhomboid family intramembrane serine protease [Bacteroidota bacterium]|nr:rhomboid family intramembrane serine protease [Bacteroidota bacterium]
MNADQRKFWNSLFVPGLFVIMIWLVKAVEWIFGIDLGIYGLYPLQWKGLIGIITSPFLHADLAHISANTIPLFVLLAMLFYFYREIAWPVFLLIWVLTNIWVWFLARDGIHIGSSGIIYGLASFLFISGIIRRDTRLMALTLLISFLYGGMIWGIFPQLFPQMHISWESHLMGIVAGIILAFYYRHSGPKRKVYEWEDEDDDDNDNTGYPYWSEPDDTSYN